MSAVDLLHGLEVIADDPCGCGATDANIMKAGKGYMLRCRQCSLLRQKLSDAVVNFLKPTIREFGAPREPIKMGRHSASSPFSAQMERASSARDREGKS